MTNEYFKLEVNFFDHAKVVDLSDAAFRLHLTAIAYANRLMTDGYIAANIARRLIDHDPLGQGLDWQDHVKELLAARLWHEVNGGYQIHDFLDHNTPRDERLRKRLAEKDRKARYRDSQRTGDAQGGDVPLGQDEVSQRDSASPSDGTARLRDAPNKAETEVETEVETEAQTKPQGATTPVAQARPVSVDVALVWDIWQQATGKTRAKLDAKRQRAIQRALKSHGLDDTLAAVQGWQHDPWEDRPRHVDVTVLLRDAEHIEKFRDLWRAGPAPPSLNGMTKARRQLYENSAALDAWVQQEETADDQGRVETASHQAQRALPAPADTA